MFKALTAIKLAEHLRDEGVNAVPMFWIASEDHDFEEVNHTRLVNREGQLVTITYTGCSPKEGQARRPRQTEREDKREHRRAGRGAPRVGVHAASRREDLRDSYSPGREFRRRFRRDDDQTLRQIRRRPDQPARRPFESRRRGDIRARDVERARSSPPRLVEATAQSGGVGLPRAGLHQRRGRAALHARRGPSHGDGRAATTGVLPERERERVSARPKCSKPSGGVRPVSAPT